ncbi:hypothetical protein SPF06_18225 [Sinomonas sp. JGH33]|uniref:Uncharacterized protein n=1 Tax=Sinomonas terricola TaxID=3110330 RepID=A0ABU5TAG3_9MICC|nr:hypothetical protein [Sinomonas sp. JGH33]MEA5456664.1 hypothetical protein [Sinomonas sp. JGH33]
MLTFGFAAALAATAVAHQLGLDAHEQLRAEVAQQLAVSVPEPSASPTSTPVPTTASGPSASTAFGGRSSSTPEPSRTPTSSPTLAAAMPPTKFSWPAAGLSVDVVPADWSAGQLVDPVLDANNFDPVAHWLKGTGQGGAVRPVVLAAHTCHAGVRLCTDATFPFNRLSYPGWAIGQPASLADANGRVISCSLDSRKVVDKTQEFAFPNDPCLVVAFSCNYGNPDAQIVLLTFRCGQCT